jgi:cytoskeletal protein RodZ
MEQTPTKLFTLISMGFFIFSCQLETQSQSPSKTKDAPGQNSEENKDSDQKVKKSRHASSDSEDQHTKDTPAGEQGSGDTPSDKPSNPTLPKGQDSSMRLAIENGLASPQAAKLNPDQKKKLGETLNGLCNDAASGKKVDPKGAQTNIKTALNLNLGQNLPIDLSAFGVPGNLGNNPTDNNNNNKQDAGLEKAIQDLVNAAQNANVDGILKAVQDIVGAT